MGYVGLEVQRLGGFFDVFFRGMASGTSRSCYDDFHNYADLLSSVIFKTVPS
jgi:hypothetical protein